jgi:hypothetical protein
MMLPAGRLRVAEDGTGPALVPPVEETLRPPEACPSLSVSEPYVVGRMVESLIEVST